MDTRTREGFIIALAIAALVGYFGSEWNHRPRYELTTSTGGGAYRVNTETGSAEICIPTESFTLRCGDAVVAWVKAQRTNSGTNSGM